MSDDCHHLWDAYRETDYQADTPLGSICIRVDQRTAQLDELLSRHAVDEWAFVTAHNPASVRQSPKDNERQHEKLRAEITNRGLIYYPGYGIGRDGVWPPEESLLILGLSEQEAIKVGRAFAQNAIVCGRRGETARLVSCIHSSP